jgi:hypothetical protein
MSYPGSVTFRPGPQTSGWAEVPSFLPPIRDFATPGSGHYPPSSYPSLPSFSHSTSTPHYAPLSSAEGINAQSGFKESSAPSQIVRRSNINDLLNASNDEPPVNQITQTTASRSAPPLEVEPSLSSVERKLPSYEWSRPTISRGFGGPNLESVGDPEYGRSLPAQSHSYQNPDGMRR